MPSASESRSARRPRFGRPQLPFLPPLSFLPSPLDALPAAINHLLAAEPWARAQLAPHAGKTLEVVLAPFAIRLTVAGDGTVLRATAVERAATTVTVPHVALPRVLAGGPGAAMRDVRIDGDADFAQAVSAVAANLRWDVEEDLSKVVGDVASQRLVRAAAGARARVRRANGRIADGVTEYLLEERPALVRPRAVQAFADRVRGLRDDLERLEKRVERLAPGGTARRSGPA